MRSTTPPSPFRFILVSQKTKNSSDPSTTRVPGARGTAVPDAPATRHGRRRRRRELVDAKGAGQQHGRHGGRPVVRDVGRGADVRGG